MDIPTMIVCLVLIVALSGISSRLIDHWNLRVTAAQPVYVEEEQHEGYAEN